MTKPFNITLIIPDGYPHSFALSEVGEYLAHFIAKCGFATELTTNFLSQDHHNVVLCGHMLTEQSFETMPADTILFNSEQLQDVEGWQFTNRVYRRALDKFYVWDYSQENLREIGHQRKAQIPLLFCEALVRSAPKREPGDTLVFYGAWNPRRAKIMQELADAGVKTAFLTGVYGEERDKILFNSWAMLNLHKVDELKVFEPVRCFYPLINDVPVISEEFIIEPRLRAFSDSIFSFDTEGFVKSVQRLYQDRGRFRTQVKRHLAKFRATDGLSEVRQAVAAYLEAVNAMA